METTTWNPSPGWLLLTPSTLPEKTEAGIFLPESFTTKATSGVVIKCGGLPHDIELLQKEVFFPRHDEYQIVDSDSGLLFYVVPSERVILWRDPKAPEEFVRVENQGTGAPRPFQRSQ